MQGGDGKDVVWVNVRPGVAMEVEYDVHLFHAGAPDDEVYGRMTGQVRMTREALRDAQWGDPMTGETG